MRAGVFGKNLVIQWFIISVYELYNIFDITMLFETFFYISVNLTKYCVYL